jgi:hypothetical protein
MNSLLWLLGLFELQRPTEHALLGMRLCVCVCVCTCVCLPTEHELHGDEAQPAVGNNGRKHPIRNKYDVHIGITRNAGGGHAGGIIRGGSIFTL